MWYQFQTKLRDEPRPKAGLMRTREFTMKDSYSFDLDAAGLDKSFDAHREAYARAFERIGIPAIPVEASNGTMGGSGSTEFICPSETGEDDIIYCPECGYAANIEAAVSGARAVGPGGRRGRGAARAASASTRRACGRSRTWPPATTRPPTGRSRPWSTCSTASSRWCCCAATTPWRSRSSSTRPARSRSRPAEARGDLRRARRPPRLARRGRRHGPAGHRRPRAAGPRRHDDRREHRRRAPARRGRGAGHHRRAVGRPARRRGRASRASAAATRSR